MGRLDWRRAPAYVIAGVVGGLLAIAHATGIGGLAPMAVLSVLAPLAIIAGVRHHRPNPAWPWLLMVLPGIAWSIAGVIRSSTGATGDLTSGRNVVPDLFAIAGYGVFAVALVAMLRAQGRRTSSRGLLIDGAMMATAAGLLGWVFLISPVLRYEGVAPIAKLAIVIYPPISAMLVWIAARLAFTDLTEGVSQRLLLGVMTALLLGDVAYVPLELGLVDEQWSRMLEMPYAIAYVLTMMSALHPSMRDVVRPGEARPGTSRTRFVFIAVALVTPGVLLVGWNPTSPRERIIVGGLALALELAAVVRVVVASRSQASVEAHLEYRATHDELTGLLNRAAIHDVVTRALGDAKVMRSSVGVLFIDLDRFKLINDSFGHVVGDDLILAAAERLSTTVDRSHTVARLSGDEFLVVARGADEAGAARLAARLCEAFTHPFELIGSVYVTASIGVVVADPRTDDVDATSLIRDADTAMYEAKDAGRSAFRVFDPGMRAASEQQLDMHTGLRLGLERDEFEVHYQLVVDPETEMVAGVEALVRWRSPDGLVRPDLFIPTAEETGLISAIGEKVLHDACEQVARWRRLAGCEHLTVAVNVSARQLVDSDLVAVVAEALDETGLPADALWLEITESVMMSDTIETLASLAGLRDLGVHLSVDDFGTGYSSLSYLQRYPIEQLKIDRRFISGLGERSEDEAVIAAVIGIAHALRLSLVAEGVETQDQADRVRDLGCQLVQGFFYGRPAPAIDVGPMLLTRNQPDSPTQPRHWR